MNRLSHCCALGAVALLTTASLASESDPAVPGRWIKDTPQNSGAFQFDFSAGFQTADFFRGVRQLENSPIVKTNVDIRANVIDTDGFALRPYIGIQNSFAERSTANPPLSFYEADIYMGLDWTFKALTIRTAYDAHPSPNGSFATIHEVEVSAWYDDAELWKSTGLPFKLAPHAGLYRELRDNNNTPFLRSDPRRLDTYIEAGITPQVSISPMGEKMPITISAPVTMGFSPDHYYDLSGLGHTASIGYLSASLIGSIPVPIPERFGHWQYEASLNYMHDYAQDARIANHNKDNLVWFQTGVGISY